MSTDTTGTPIDFDALNPGDRVAFATRDNGFGGSGDWIDRTGTVTGKTDKTVTVQVHDPVRQEVFERGKARTYGLTARLTRRTWTDRRVRLLEALDTVPRDAEHVVHLELTNDWIVAVYTSDPNLSGRPDALRKAYYDNDPRVEELAQATRYRLSRGHSFPGWVITGQADQMTDPIARKPEAFMNLDMVAREAFDDTPELSPAQAETLLYISNQGALRARYHGPADDLLRRGLVTCDGRAYYITEEGIRVRRSLEAARDPEPATQGTTTEHAHHEGAQSVIRTLAAGGFQPGTFGDEYDPETSSTTGFYVAPHGDHGVRVWDLLNGKPLHRADADAHLREMADHLRQDDHFDVTPGSITITLRARD